MYLAQSQSATKFTHALFGYGFVKSRTSSVSLVPRMITHAVVGFRV